MLYEGSSVACIDTLQDKQVPRRSCFQLYRGRWRSIFTRCPGYVVTSLQPPVRKFESGSGNHVIITAGVGWVHPVFQIILYDKRLRLVHAAIGADCLPLVFTDPDIALLGRTDNVVRERLFALGNPVRVVLGKPSPIEIVQEVKGKQIPNEPFLRLIRFLPLQEELLEKLLDGIVVLGILVQKTLADMRVGKLDRKSVV